MARVFPFSRDRLLSQELFRVRGFCNMLMQQLLYDRIELQPRSNRLALARGNHASLDKSRSEILPE